MKPRSRRRPLSPSGHLNQQMIKLIAKKQCLSPYDASLSLAEGSKKMAALKQKYLREYAAKGGVLPWKGRLGKEQEGSSSESSDSEVSFNFKHASPGHFESRTYESEISNCETKMKIRDISGSSYRARRMSMRPSLRLYAGEESKSETDRNDRRKRKVVGYDEEETMDAKRKIPRITIKMKDPNGDIEEVVTSSEDENQSRQSSPAADMEEVGSLRRRRELAKEQSLGVFGYPVKIKSRSPSHQSSSQSEDWEVQDSVPLSQYLDSPRKLSNNIKPPIQDNSARRIHFKMGGSRFCSKQASNFTQLTNRQH
ncbi:putative ubiquitin carboxyl-terminal hydrolase 36 [Apostichopus japonicus]|uniref:Putative ubiquitin carboxyl-terminal hydrolase 36 n=1 Tax=Stichopus japonicus TaxID=307972 RepID=A0A2G8JXU5_STIJA|nr:putative ubiquitin carboxyl-terminal hydrolase 36 [Apostichopus japonicus]